MNSHIKALGGRGVVLGFVILPFFFLLGTPHHEIPRGNPHELHADAVREVLGWVFFWLGVDSITCQRDEGGNESKAKETIHGRILKGQTRTKNIHFVFPNPRFARIKAKSKWQRNKEQSVISPGRNRGGNRCCG